MAEDTQPGRKVYTPVISSQIVSSKHTDLSDKEVAGVIDHADDSVNAAKLAHNIDATGIGFDADMVDGKHASELGGLWQVIETKKLSIAANSFTFAGISASYDMLRLTIRALGSSLGYLSCQINGWTGAVYRNQLQEGAGVVTATFQEIGTNQWRLGRMVTSYPLKGIIIFESTTTQYPGMEGHTGTGNERLWQVSGLAASAAAKISSIKLYHELGVGNNLVAGTIFTLEGFAI